MLKFSSKDYKTALKIKPNYILLTRDIPPIQRYKTAPGQVAQLVTAKVVGSIPGQGTYNNQLMYALIIL